MKKIIFILTALIWTASVLAQAPQKMSYQAVIRDGGGNLLLNQGIGMRISILNTTTPIFIETQTAKTDANGLVTLEIGAGSVVLGKFTSIDWSAGDYTIKTETDPTATGGTTYTITGTSKLLSVPYALHAKTAESITGTSGGSFMHYIGELYGGGIIVSVWKASGVEHGLIASLTDLSAGIIWTTPAYQSISVPGGASSPIDGMANSNAIVAQAGAGTTYAAGLCRAYSAPGDGGLNDWYLPATWELNLCFNAAFVVNPILGITIHMYDASYWSSTERAFSTAFNQTFFDGYKDFGGKTGNGSVRAVRRF
jgi:hypothetical protein